MLDILNNKLEEVNELLENKNIPQSIKGLIIESLQDLDNKIDELKTKEMVFNFNLEKNKTELESEILFEELNVEFKTLQSKIETDLGQMIVTLQSNITPQKLSIGVKILKLIS